MKQAKFDSKIMKSTDVKLCLKDEDVIILDKPHGGLYSAPPDETSPTLRRRNGGKEKYIEDDVMSRDSEEAERLKAELDQSKNQLDNLFVFPSISKKMKFSLECSGNVCDPK